VQFGGANKWVVCGLLLAATVLNYLDRQVLSLTAEKIIAEFQTDKRGFGELIAAFRFSYATVQFLGGWIVDALGPRMVFSAAVGLWSCAGMLTGLAGGLGSMSAYRFILGIGEAFNWPCALKVTERLLEPKDRVLANGIFNSGTALGALMAPVIVTVLTLRFGWRSSFLVTGAVGFFWIVLWRAFTSKRAEVLAGRGVQFGDVPGIMASIGRKRDFWLLASSAIIVNSVSYFLADWIPLYLKTERGFGFGSGNILSMLVYGGLDAGNLLAGAFVRSAAGRGITVGTARNFSLIISCVLMTSATAVGIVRSAYVAVAFLILTAIGVAAFLVVYLTLVQEISPPHIGAVAGMLGGMGNMAYALISPFIGRLADVNRSGVAFLLVGCLPWLALVSILPVARRSSRLAVEV
jgi:MFS transporter, ACS family, hexuronate transporter